MNNNIHEALWNYLNSENSTISKDEYFNLARSTPNFLDAKEYFENKKNNYKIIKFPFININDIYFLKKKIYL